MNKSPDVTISVCLCTYKRPDALMHCLKSLLEQDTSQTYEVIVVDNDRELSGKPTVERLSVDFAKKNIFIDYLVEPVQNIALARNRTVSGASGDYVAFLDDDERASPCWLKVLCSTLQKEGVDGVWGPVLPIIPDDFPDWMKRSAIFERPRPKNKSEVARAGLRTSNAIVKRSLLKMRPGPFDEKLGRTGGEDTEFFSWLADKKTRFIWADEAPVYEELESKRKKMKWHLRRAYRGGWGYSREQCLRNSKGIGFFLSLLPIVPSFLRAILKAVLSITNPKYALFLILTNFATHLGKIGFYFGLKVYEYN